LFILVYNNLSFLQSFSSIIYDLTGLFDLLLCHVYPDAYSSSAASSSELLPGVPARFVRYGKSFLFHALSCACAGGFQPALFDIENLFYFMRVFGTVL
jgi:hypothetical protein